MTERRVSPRRDGFTLIEVLIVTVSIGIITAALTATVSVVLRNTPPTEVRSDDARTMQGLVTWLPEDVDAAPPSGFNRSHTYWPCTGSAPANSHNILTAAWTEQGATPISFAATYRYEQVGDGWSMVRYYCEGPTPATLGTPERINLTSDLPVWNATTPPAWVDMCSAHVDTNGACPSGDVIPTTVDQPDPDINGYEMKSLKLSITRADGEVATIDAAPKNPDQDLADDPYASVNKKPVLTVGTVTVDMYPGESATFDLNDPGMHQPVDPDGDPISAAIDSTEVIPTGLTASASDPLFVHITTDPSMTVGTVTGPIVLIVSDNRAGWQDALIRVRIVPAPNNPPTQTAVDVTIDVQPGQTVVVPLDVTHGIVDPDGDPLSAAILLSPPSMIADPPTLGGPGPLDLTLNAPPGATPGSSESLPITLEVTDGHPLTTPLTVNVWVQYIAASNSAPVAATSSISHSMQANDSVSFSLADLTWFGVSDPDGDALQITNITGPTGVTITNPSDLDVVVTTDLGLSVGVMSPAITFTVEDINGASIDVKLTIEIIPTPEPPSDCVLGTLSASQSVWDRHAEGGQPHLLVDDIVITLTYSGSCDGLHLQYDSGDTSGLGLGAGRVFPAGSPTSVIIVSKDNGGTEKFAPGSLTLTAKTTSAVTPDTVTLTVTVD